MKSAKSGKRPDIFRLAVLLVVLALLGMFYLEQRKMRLGQDLISAVIDGDERKARDLLESGADPNSRMVGLGLAPDSANLWERILRMLRLQGGTREIRGRTVLYQAIISEHPEIVRALIKHGADVNSRVGGGDAPIVRAVSTMQTILVRYLIEAGADLTAKSRDGESLIMRAAATGEGKTLEMLAARGADVNEFDSKRRTPLRLAAEKGHIEAISVLLRHGARVRDIGAAGPFGFHIQPGGPGYPNPRSAFRAGAGIPPVSPLLIASQSRSPELIRAAWDAGGSSHKDNSVGAQCLEAAVRAGNEEALRTLLDLGIPFKETGSPGNSLLHTAILVGNSSLVQFLLARGATVNAADASGRLPLHIAASTRTPGLVALLLRHGADPNAADLNNGQTPLHVMITEEAADALLSDRRVKIDARNHDGKTPLMTVPHSQVRKLLIERGADVNARDALGASVLLHAVRSRDEAFVRELLAAGADPRIPDYAGKTPLSEASTSTFPALRRTLELALAKPAAASKK